MVLVECKRLPKEEYSKDYDAFLASFPGDTNIGVATDALQKMQNMRVRLKWMVGAAKQLAKDSCEPDQQHHLLGPVRDTEACLSLERNQQRQVCTLEELNTLVSAFKGGAMILFPEECSGIDACQRLTALFEAETTPDATKSKVHRILSLIDDGATNEATLVGEAVMWWSGRPLARDADFFRYIGKNDKTKITVKLAPVGADAPPREPGIDARAQAELVAYYHRKQEENKKLVEDEDISYGNSEWANPYGLKSQLQGFSGIKYRPS